MSLLFPAWDTQTVDAGRLGGCPHGGPLAEHVAQHKQYLKEVERRVGQLGGCGVPEVCFSGLRCAYLPRRVEKVW